MRWWTTSSSFFSRLSAKHLGKSSDGSSIKKPLSVRVVHLIPIIMPLFVHTHTTFRHLHFYQLHSSQYLSLSFLLGCRLLPLQCIRNLFNVPRKHSTVLHLSNFLFLRQIVNFRLVSNSVQHYCNHHINSIDIHTARSVHTHTHSSGWIQLLLNIHRP